MTETFDLGIPCKVKVLFVCLRVELEFKMSTF